MPKYYVDDGGDGTQTNGTNGTWAKADTNLVDADTTIAFTNGDIVYFGADSTDPYTYTGHTTFTLPTTNGAGVTFISATQGSNPETYSAATTWQIDTSDGAWNAIFNGSVAIYGMKIRSGGDVRFQINTVARATVKNSTLRLGANGQIWNLADTGVLHLQNVLVDLTDDGTTSRGNAVFTTNSSGTIQLEKVTFTNPAYRTGELVTSSSNGITFIASSCDFSGFASTCEFVNLNTVSSFTLSNCLTAATWTPVANNARSGATVLMVNVGPDDAPTYIYHNAYPGVCVSSASIYRTGGATVEAEACSWLITTMSNAGEALPYLSPWIYFAVSSTGSKTFDIYTTNDTADFTDAEVWMEVEYLGTADEANTLIVTDQRTITTTAAAQTDDTTSTWNGSGPAFTYKQKLSVSATVNETGMHRARVVVGAASIASSRYFYVDPKVTVT